MKVSPTKKIYKHYKSNDKTIKTSRNNANIENYLEEDGWFGSRSRMGIGDGAEVGDENLCFKAVKQEHSTAYYPEYA